MKPGNTLNRLVAFVLAMMLLVAVFPLHTIADDTSVESSEAVADDYESYDGAEEFAVDILTEEIDWNGTNKINTETVVEGQIEQKEETTNPVTVSTATEQTVNTPVIRSASSESDYEISLGADGVTSAYNVLDEEMHTIGSYSVHKTYVFSFKEESFAITNNSGIRISSSGMVLINGAGVVTGSIGKGIRREADYLKNTVQACFTDLSVLSAAGYTGVDSDVTAYYYLYFTTLQYAILIQITPNGSANPKTIAREDLGGLIASVTGEHANDWVQTDDRYNGRTYSTDGFWTELQPFLATAQSTYENTTASIDELNTAVTELQAAIDNLIPVNCVNPTELYETYHEEIVAARKQSDYTAQTWEVYEAALSEAEALLNGVLVNDTLLPKDQQSLFSVAAQAINDSASDLFLVTLERYATNARPLLPALIAEASRAQEEDYTAESWAVFADAFETAEAAVANTDELTGTSSDAIYRDAFDALYNAYYWGLVPTGEISIKIIVQDAYYASMRYAIQPLRFGASASLTLSGGYTLADAAAMVGVYFTDGNLYTDYLYPTVGDRAHVYVNGVYVTNASNGVNPYYCINTKELLGNAANLTMHPGDTVVLTTNALPQTNMGANIYTDMASFEQYIDSLYTSAFWTDDGILTVHAGEEYTVNIEKTTGALGRSGITSAAEGMTLFAGSVQKEPIGNTTPERMKNNGELIVTDENGEAIVTMYEEGWVLLSAYDLRDDELGDYDSVNGEYVLPGKYHSTNAGAAVWVHVLPSEEPDAVKAALQAELDEVYAKCDQTIFPDEERDQLNSLYQTATAGIASAATTGEARSAQQTGILAIQELYKAVITDNASKLSTFRSCLEQMPEDLSLVTVAQQGLVDTLLSTYEAMSDYLHSQLTAGEIERYELIAALGELPDAVSYNVNVIVQADSEAASAVLQAMTEWLSENSPREDKIENGWEYNAGDELEHYAYPFVVDLNNEKQYATAYEPNAAVKINLNEDYSAYYHIRFASDPVITGEGWSIVDAPDSGISFEPRFHMNYNIRGSFAIMVDNVEYEVKRITIEGVESYTESGFASVLDRSGYKGKDFDWVNLWFLDGLYSFTMPYNDVTVTVTWGPVHDAVTDAIEALTEHYNSFVRGNYTEENWAELAELYQAGIAAIKTATDPEATKDSYIALMDAVETTGAQTLLGSVTVTVSNNTMADGPFFDETEPFVNETISLYDTDTMMTVALRALEENGFTYEGTGGSGNGISYLASVTLGVDTLSEKMPGYGGSGWMGMLNNWFVNESLQNFSVQNGMLKNGDKVELVFTCDMGLDVRAGVEGIQDTSMLTITSDAGTLSPAFDAETEEYILALPEGQETARLSFEPQWRCFQARAYKGSYTPAAENYYSSGDMMYLTNGDVIYVASGDPAWPSMSGNDGVALTASVYKITVITSAAVNEVEELIDALKTVKYSNYTDVRGSVENARAAYDALNEEAKAQIDPALYAKLTTSEILIAQYAALDEFKAKLAGTDAETVDAETARKIVEAYDAMTDNQKNNLTGAETAKVETLRAMLVPEPEIQYGDLDGDGQILTSDAARLYAFIRGTYELSEEQIACADVNSDGEINTTDAAMIYAFLRGQISSFPAQTE